MKQYHEIKSNERIKKEAKILQFVGKLHKNIVQFYHHMEIKKKVLIFMEICSQESLEKVIMRKTGEYWTEDFLLKKFATITNVLALLHWKTIDVAHRDLKPQNIFVCENDEWKIGDFGGAKRRYVTCNNLNTIEGTENYMSPLMLEKWKEGPKSSEIDPKKEDVYSLGKTFYEVLTKNINSTFEEGEAENREKIKAEMLGKKYSEELIKIILEMVTHDPKIRPTMNEVHEKINQLIARRLTMAPAYLENQIEIQMEEKKGFARESEDIFSLEAISEIKIVPISSQCQSQMRVEEEKVSAREGNNVFSIESWHESSIEERKRIEALMDIDSTMQGWLKEYFVSRSIEFPLTSETESSEAIDQSSFSTDNLATDNRIAESLFSTRPANQITEPSSPELSNNIKCPNCWQIQHFEMFKAFVSTSLDDIKVNPTDIYCIICGNKFPEDFINDFLAHKQ
ncbi:unnamed protein product [Blepharisma stoltei]|uniref:non-specific serine/threonine protein kinase n=1 Tax=Blepharisma stoltei TaxID=1481888 RepID=A0AAU9K9T0_9CILI|nr:unnamed protein product [Blepharisma stoltei]